MPCAMLKPLIRHGKNAYILMKQSEETLFNRRFTYFDRREKKPIKSRWLQDVRYLDDEGLLRFALLAWWLNVLHV